MKSRFIFLYEWVSALSGVGENAKKNLTQITITKRKYQILGGWIITVYVTIQPLLLLITMNTILQWITYKMH